MKLHLVNKVENIVANGEIAISPFATLFFKSRLLQMCQNASEGGKVLNDRKER